MPEFQYVSPIGGISHFERDYRTNAGEALPAACLSAGRAGRDTGHFQQKMSRPFLPLSEPVLFSPLYEQQFFLCDHKRKFVRNT